jgi:hypothetical protein
MKIKEIVLREAEAPVEAEPTPQDVEQIQGLLGTIDPVKEQPQSLLGKLTGWIKQYPMLDKATDLLPQTRLIKAIASAVDALETGDSKTALASLASGLTGGVGKAVQQVNTLANVGTNLAQGNVQGAALAAGGKIGTVAKGVDVTQNLAQNNLQGAAQAMGGGVAKAANLATKAQNYLATVPTDDPLQQVKKNAGLA